MKKIRYVLIIALIFLSCTNDDDFVELSTYKDFMMKLTIFLDTNRYGENYEINVIDYKTNGFNQLISFSGFHRGTISNQPAISLYYSVKEYKTVGIKIIPIENNVIGYRLTINEIGSFYPYNIFILDIEEDIDREVTIFYDFETGKTTLE